MTLRHIKILIIILTGTTSLLSQSFSKTYSDSIVNQGTFFVAKNENFVSLKRNTIGNSADKGAVVSKYSSQGDPIWSVDLPDLDYRFVGTTGGSGFQNICPIILLESGDMICGSNIRRFNESFDVILCLDIEGNLKWSREINYQFNSLEYPSFLQLESNSFLIIHCSRSTFNTKTLSLIKFDLSGNLISEKHFVDSEETDETSYFFSVLNDSRFCVIKRTSEYSRINFFDSEFNFLESIKVDALISQVLFTEGKEYVLVGQREELPFISDVFLAKLNKDLKIEWSKQVDARPSSGLYKINEIQSNIFLSTIDFIRVKTILLKISNEGDFLEARMSEITGSRRNNFIKFNEFSFLDHLFHEDQDIIYTSDSNLDNNCFQTKVCVNLEDIQISVEKEMIEIFSPHSVNFTVIPFALTIETIIPSSEDICLEGNNEFPSPNFVTEDTVCVNEPIIITNLQNENVASTLWNIENSTLPVSVEASPGLFTYSQSGKFVISQQIEFDGCTEVFSKEIVVVDQNIIDLETDFEICMAEPIVLDASTEGILTYNWQDGSSEPTLSVNEAGTYSVQIEDRYCVQEVFFDVSDFDFELISTDLGQDTLICIQEPIRINPMVNAGVNFQWQDNHPTLSRDISEEGLYTLITTLGRCSTSTSKFVEVDDCETNLYMPSIFSPNGDGINDTIIPLGKNFELLNYGIYDRWGNKVHDQISAWNGKFRNQDAPVGVYVYSLTVRNQQLDSIETLKGNFSLAR